MIYVLCVLALLVFFIAGASNGIMDACTHKHEHPLIKDRQFWNNHPVTGSHLNKYVNRDPKQGRRKLFWKINYPVAFTDAWHLFKSIMLWSFPVAQFLGCLMCWFGAVNSNPYLWLCVAIIALGGRIAFGAGFVFVYDVVFKQSHK